MWNEPDIGLIGRDTLLKNKILPRLNGRKSFILSGNPGIGKTALIQWAFEKCKALCGEITIPFFELLIELEKKHEKENNTVCLLLWGAKGKGKTNLAYWLIQHRMKTEPVYVLCIKEQGMDKWPSGVAAIAGTNYNYPEIEQTLKLLLYKMRTEKQRFTVVIDELNIMKMNIPKLCELWLPFVQEGRQRGVSLIAIGQGKTADSIGLKGKYDLTKCFDMIIEVCFKQKQNKRYLIVEGDKDKDPEKLMQPVKFGTSDIPHPNPTDRTLPKKAFSTGALAHGQMVKDIADQWGLCTNKLTVKQIETLILKETGNYLFIDELIRLQEASITLMKVLKERNTVFGAMRNERMKENLKQLLWGFEIIRIGALSRNDALRLAEKAAVHFGVKLSFSQIANAAAGVPGRIHSFCTTGEIPREDTRMSSEELDISPVVFICLICVIAMRYVGRATSATDLVILGSAAMLAMIIVRGMFTRSQERK